MRALEGRDHDIADLADLADYSGKVFQCDADLADLPTCLENFFNSERGFMPTLPT